MKEHTELFSRNIFTHFPPYRVRQQRKIKLLDLCKIHFPGLAEQFLSLVAAAAIGTIMLVGISLFFVQLAEYGWR